MKYLICEQKIVICTGIIERLSVHFILVMKINKCLPNIMNADKLVSSQLRPFSYK